jgi:predicted nicotinamide N-methyase
VRDERIAVGGHELVVARPDDPERLIDESRFEVDEFLPYWAELWPSGIALAEHVSTLALGGRSVLELGCGLALPSFTAAIAGADAVVATDWAPEALELVTANAAANGLTVSTALLHWHEPGSFRDLGRFDVVLAADVLYEERNAAPFLAALEALVAAGGTALVADPGRRHAPAFFEQARASGWSVEDLPTPRLPAGYIAILRRAASAAGGTTLC